MSFAAVVDQTGPAASVAAAAVVAAAAATC